MITLAVIREALAAHEAATLEAEESRRAAVAVILRERSGAPELLFIERARHPADPWSGHMAFPGGRVDPDDAGPRAAAERETLEEVGIDLDGAELLGQLDDLRGHAAASRQLVVSAFVYAPKGPLCVEHNHEVEETLWFPVNELLDPARRTEYPLRLPGRHTLPGILVGEPDRHIVWGLTYRFLEILFQRLGSPLQG